MRPVGGALVGYIGDKLGRRAALTFSVTAMAIPTFLVGILPGYQVLGMAAPFLLTVLRMIQGLSVGGEYTTSIVFMVEHAPPGRRGLIGAVGCCGAVGGILLGSATGALAERDPAGREHGGVGLAHPVRARPGGRAGRLLPAPPSRRGRDPAGWPDIRRSARRCAHHGWLLVRLAGLSAFNAVGFYLLFVYIVSWLQLADGIAPAHALEINSLSMVVLLPWHDRDGRAVGPDRPQADAARRDGDRLRVGACRCSC